MSSMAEDIGLFGLRKKLKKAEEEAVEIVKEGIGSAEEAERGIEKAEKEIETQAGVVAAEEVVGIVITSSVVNGILGPESR
ncbi:hypothetical protein LXL04_016608 [Taraxacum kok-saghyz]